MPPALPPPRRRVSRSQPSPRSLSRALVVAAALKVLDQEGLAAVTMRRVSAELGTGPASLYAHVADKEEMIAAVLDAVLAEVRIPSPPDPSRWQEQLHEVIHSVRSTFGRHRDIAGANLGGVPTGDNGLTISNAMLGILLAGDVSQRVAALAVDTLSLYVSAAAYEESLRQPGPNRAYGEHDYHWQLRTLFGALPPERFPHLVTMAVPLTTGGDDERFDFGLDLLIRGIASTVTSGQ